MRTLHNALLGPHFNALHCAVFGVIYAGDVPLLAAIVVTAIAFGAIEVLTFICEPDDPATEERET